MLLLRGPVFVFVLLLVYVLVPEMVPYMPALFVLFALPCAMLAYRLLLLLVCLDPASEFMLMREPVPYNDDVAPSDAELAGTVSEHVLLMLSLLYLPMNEGYAGGEDADVNFRGNEGLRWMCSTGVPWILAGELCGETLVGAS